jgi:large subunit ribosomal protein L35e
MVEKKINHNIRQNDTNTIRANIEKLKEELRGLRNAKASSGSASKLAKIKGVRKNIARNLTALNAKERANAVGNLHQGSKRRPIYVRSKLTRAIRRRLTTHQKTKQIEKVQKRSLNFPTRKYGLRA